jgi:hypothetical protein
MGSQSLGLGSHPEQTMELGQRIRSGLSSRLGQKMELGQMTRLVLVPKTQGTIRMALHPRSRLEQDILKAHHQQERLGRQ